MSGDPIRARLDSIGDPEWPVYDAAGEMANALSAVLDVHDPDEVGMCNGCWWESKDADNQTPIADCEVRKALAAALGVDLDA